MDINTIREKYPQYSDLSDQQLVDGLHKKFYSDIPLDEFHAKVGFASEEPKGNVSVEGVPEATIGSRIAGGLKQSYEDYKTYLQTIGAPQEELNRLAAESLDKQRAISKEIGQTRGSKEVGEAYDKSGILGAAKEVATQAPGFIASSLPQMGEVAAGAATGAALGLATPVPGGMAAGAIMGGFAALYPQFFSQNIAEQSEAMQESGIPKDISAGKAAAAATGQALLEEAGKGYAIGKNLLTSMLGKIPTTKAAKALATDELVKAAESTLKNVGAGMVRGSAEEAFVNPAQDILSRAQAGEDLFSKEALKGYGESMYQGALAGFAMGPVTGTLETRAARGELAKQGLDNTGQPIATPTQASTQPSMVVNAQGALVPNPLQNTSTKQPATTPVTPIPTNAQSSLFTPEELPATNKTLTPDTLTGQTEAGKPVEIEALQAPERAQAEIERSIFALQQQEQTPKVKEQIAALQEQLPKGPGETLDILKQEFTTLGNKGEALQAQKQTLIDLRDNTPKLAEKAPITEQIKAIDSQIETIANRQQELLKQGGEFAKKITTAEPAKQTMAAEDLWALAKPAAIIDNKIMEGFGLTKKAPIRKALNGLDMNSPEDRETFINEINKHAIKGAKINDKAVSNYFSWFSPNQEIQNDGHTGDVNGATERSLQLPSTGIQTAPGTTTPAPTGVGSAVGTTEQLDGGAAPSGETGTPALAATPTATPVAQATPAQAIQATTGATPAATPVAQPINEVDNAVLFQAAGGKTKPKFISRVISNTISKLKSWADAYENNQLISTQMFGRGQNLFSFDDGFNNRLRAGFMNLVDKGEISLEQFKNAMLRASMTQALYRSEIAHKFMSMGNLAYDAMTNRWTAVNDAVNMNKFQDLIKSFATRTGVDVDTALDQMSKAYEASRVMEFYNSLANTRAEITRTDKKIKELSANKKRTKAESKDLDKKRELLKELKKKAEDLEHKTMHMTRQQALIGMQLYNANPEIGEGTQVWNTMRKRTIDWLVRTGVKTEE